MTPCPDGWSEIEDPGHPDIVTCSPFPKTGPGVCGLDEAHFPGRPVCERIGEACPVGDFAEGIPADATVTHVKAGAPAGGDGSVVSPYYNIADAIAAAPDGAIVALSKGTFDEAVTVRRGITLWGACVAQTVVASSTPSDSVATITLTGSGGGGLRNLRISGARVGVDVYANDGQAVIEAVVIDGATLLGLWLGGGGDLVARDFVVRDTRPWSGGFGDGMEVGDGAIAVLERASFEGNRTTGIDVYGVGTLLTAGDLGVLSTAPRERDEVGGVGLQVTDGGSVEVSRASLEGNHAAGIVADGAGTSLVATDLVVRGTEARATDGLAGFGIELSGGAHGDIGRAWLEGNREAALQVAGSGTELVGADLVASETRSRESDGTAGLGLDAHGGGRCEMTRAAFVRNRTIGLFATEAGTEVVATDLLVLDTLPQDSDGRGGDGVRLEAGAHGTITRASLLKNRVAGISASDGETELLAVDVSISETVQGVDGGGGGLQLDGGASVRLERASLEDNVGTSILALGAGTELSASDLAVRRTVSSSDGSFGDGLQVGEGALASVLRAAFEANRRIGVLADGVGTLAMLEEVAVEDTLEASCAASGCKGAFGTGIVAADGARLSATGFRSSGNVLCGVQIAGADLDLHRGEVSGNSIGVNVQAEGFDLERLQDDVVYLDNVVDLDSQLLPVPEPARTVAP